MNNPYLSLLYLEDKNVKYNIGNRLLLCMPLPKVAVLHRVFTVLA
jgi:hypothetical protein